MVFVLNDPLSANLAQAYGEAEVDVRRQSLAVWAKAVAVSGNKGDVRSRCHTNIR